MPPPNTSACPKCELLALRLAAKNASKRSLNYTASQLALKTLIPGSLFISLALFTASVAQTAIPNQPSAAPSLTILVVDENGVVVPAARVMLQNSAGSVRCETNLAGRCQLTGLSGEWQLRVEKEGFYVFTLPRVQTSGTLEVALTHQQEVRETVSVVESSPAIDPSQVSSQEQLSGLDIINIPYPSTRDYRYVLNYIPGVVLDQNAQPHIAGAETYQTLTLLDGFDVTQPANGQLLVRVSTDALRSVNVETSRLPAEYGKEPAGILGLERFITHAEFFHRAAPVVLGDYVRGGQHFAQHFAAAFGLEVDCDAALIAVHDHERRRLAAFQDRCEAAAVVAAGDLLDLDDIGAHVGEHHSADRARHDVSKFNDAHARKRSFAACFCFEHFNAP